MKSGNVIETGVEGGASTKSKGGWGARTQAASRARAAVKNAGAAAVDIASQRFLSVAQVAKRWGVSESTVRRLIEEGELNGIRLRYACKLSAASVEAYELRARF